MCILWCGFPDSTLAQSKVIDLAADSDAVRIDGRRFSDEFGNVAAVCDINADGLDDLIVAAYEGNGPDGARFSAGEVSVIFGRRGLWQGPVDVTSISESLIFGQEPFDGLGRSLACGDINGDSFDDLLLGAYLGDGPDNTRSAAGQVHIIFGGPTLIHELDLLTADHTVIYGELGNSSLASSSIAAGDVNADGISDLILSAVETPDRNGGFVNVGRSYLLFGREMWPDAIDLAVERDVTIYGESHMDAFGAALWSDDIDNDGTDDILVYAASGDGPADSRTYAGDTRCFWGRTSWPSVIDLRSESADMIIYGASAEDRAGGRMAIGDVDLDGHIEIILGARGASARDGTGDFVGRGFVYEPYPDFPSSVDLAVDWDSIIHGVDDSDNFCSNLSVGDFDGDSGDDFACSANLAWGADNQSKWTGEIHVFLGREDFPLTPGIDQGDQDWTIYGRQAGDRLALIAAGDLNGDGIDELIGSTLLGNSTILSSAWLISPLDVDGDGITQLPDNCPLVANPLQEDTDGDLIGDACHGDYDGDGQSDEEDCAPNNALAGTAEEVIDLHFEGQSKSMLVWTSPLFSDRFDISRSLISALPGGDYGSCQNARDADLTDTSFDEPDIPLTESSFTFLVRGRNDSCGTGGSWGTISDGPERANVNAQACP